MFKIAANNIITMERGDSGSFQIYVDLGTPRAPKPYCLQDGDNVYLGVLEAGQLFEDAIIKKTYSAKDQKEGALTIEFSPLDTLRLIPGTYYYEIKLRQACNTGNVIQYGIIPSEVHTIMPKTKFIIWE